MIDLQTIVAAILIGGAFVYAATMFLRKTKAFSPKSSDCGDDCGCSSKSSASKALH